MARMFRHESVGAVWTDDFSSPSDLRKRGSFSANVATTDGPWGKPATHLGPLACEYATSAYSKTHGAGSVTAMCWCRADAGAGYPILTDDGVVGASFAIWITPGTGTAVAMVQDVSSNSASKTGTTDVTDEAWHHLCLVLNRAAGDNKVHIYVDGIEEGTGTDASGVGSLPTPTQIGAYHITTSGATYIDVSEMQVYPLALSAAEILAIKEGTVFDYSKYQAAHWQMDAINAKDTGWLSEASDLTGVSITSTNIIGGLYGGGRATDYDGSADYSYRTAASWRGSDYQGAISVLFKRDATGTWIALFASCDTATDENQFIFGVSAANNLHVIVKVGGSTITSQNGDTTTIASGEWHHAVLSSDGSAYSFFVDGIPQHITTSGGTNTGEWLGDVPLRDVISIAAAVYNATDRMLNGQIADIQYFTQPLNGLQAMDLGNMLKLGVA